MSSGTNQRIDKQHVLRLYRSHDRNVLLIGDRGRCYFQPLLVISIISFVIIGAVAGHIVQSLQFTLVSINGLVAFSGIMVADSIVVIDLINRRIEFLAPLQEALLDAVTPRCRAVLPTSVITIGGMLPILLKSSR